MAERDLKYRLLFEDKYSAALAKSQRSTDKFATKQKSAWKGVSAGIKSAGAMMVGYFGVTAMLSYGRALTDYAVKVDNLSKTYDVQIDTLQELMHVADIAGISSDNLAKGYKRLSAATYDAIKGSKLQIEAFEDLGIKEDQLVAKSRNLDKFFSEILERLGQMENASDRNAIAQKLLGRAGSELGAVYSMTSKEIDGLRKNFRDLGGVMTQEQILKVRALDDSWTNLKVSLGSIARDLSVEVVPVMEKYATAIANIVAGHRNLAAIPAAQLTEAAAVNAQRLKDGLPLLSIPGSATEAGEGVSLPEPLNKIGPTDAPFAEDTDSPYGRIDVIKAMEESGELEAEDAAHAAWLDQVYKRKEEQKNKLEELLRTGSMSELQILEEKHAWEIHLLTGNKNALLKLEGKYEQKKKQLRHASFAKEWGEKSAMAGAMTALTESTLGENHAITKGFAISEALINTYAGVTEAFRFYPPPQSWAMAAQTLAMGISQVKAIKGSSPGGGGAVPSLSGGGGAPASTLPEPESPEPISQEPEQAGGSRVINVSFSGTVLGEEEWVKERLAPIIKEAVSDRVDFGLEISVQGRSS